MISPLLPDEEPARLKNLRDIDLLDSPTEAEFDDIVKLASELCSAPISLITLVDTDRQWFKAKIGLDASQTSRDVSFCGHAILQDHLFEVPNALDDLRFRDNPLVVNDPSIRFYAGMPLITSLGYRLGTLCVIDSVPRILTDGQRFALGVLSRNVIKIAELRLKNKQLNFLAEKHKKLNSILAHDIRNPLGAIKSIIEFKRTGLINEEESEEMMEVATKQLDETIQMLDDVVDWGKSQLAFYRISQEEVALNEIAESIFTHESVNGRLKQNKFVNDTSGITIRSDKQAISLILRNLVSNAVKFTENGIITISARQSENGTTLSVADTGIGMKPQEAAELFGDHHTSTTGTRNEKGSGLGLTLVKEFVTKLNGQIKAESVPAKGTVITISFN